MSDTESEPFDASEPEKVAEDISERMEEDEGSGSQFASAQSMRAAATDEELEEVAGAERDISEGEHSEEVSVAQVNAEDSGLQQMHGNDLDLIELTTKVQDCVDMLRQQLELVEARQINAEQRVSQNFLDGRKSEGVNWKKLAIGATVSATVSIAIETMFFLIDIVLDAVSLSKEDKGSADAENYLGLASDSSCLNDLLAAADQYGSAEELKSDLASRYPYYLVDPKNTAASLSPGAKQYLVDFYGAWFLGSDEDTWNGAGYYVDTYDIRWGEQIMLLQFFKYLAPIFTPFQWSATEKMDAINQLATIQGEDGDRAMYEYLATATFVANGSTVRLPRFAAAQCVQFALVNAYYDPATAPA